MGERLRIMAVERRGLLRVGFTGEVLVGIVEGCTSVASVRHGCGMRLTVEEKKFEFFFLFVFFLRCTRF